MRLLDLAPWEQLPYIQTVKETVFSTATPGTTLVTPNNMRVALGFSCTAGGTGASVTTRSGNVTGGIQISGNNPFLWMTTDQYSTLPTLQWYGTSSSTLTVIEVILVDWPKHGDDPLSAIAHPPAPFPTPSPVKGQGVNNDQGVLSYWRSLMQKIGGK